MSNQCNHPPPRGCPPVYGAGAGAGTARLVAKTASSAMPACVNSYCFKTKGSVPFSSTIKVFDDRIEFFNPGALMDDLTVEKIKTGNYKSHLRNKQVASIFRELNLIEKYGSGVRRVIDTFTAYGLPAPEFEATQGGMAVTVFKAREPAKVGGVSGGVNGGVNGGVTADASQLLQLIRSIPGLKTTEFVAHTGKPKRSIERWLKQLKAQGQIEFRGAPKTGGYHATVGKDNTP